jgi:outer membrane protein assembly factor BamB
VSGESRQEGWRGRCDGAALSVIHRLRDLLRYAQDQIPAQEVPLRGDYFYVCADNGVFSAYDAKTGRMVYQERLPRSFSASPVAGDGKVFMSSEDGDVYVVKVGAKFERLATNPMGEPLMATPAISGGMIIMRGLRSVYAVTQSKSERTPQNASERKAAN